MILQGDVKIEGVASVQKSQPDEGMSSLVLDFDDKITARVCDTLDAALILLVRADREELSCLPVLEANEALLALSNNSQSASPEGLVDITPVLRSVATT